MIFWLRNTIKEGIIRNRIHVVTCASIASWAWSQLINTSISGLQILTIFVTMFCIYGWNRLYDSEEDEINSPKRPPKSRYSKLLLFYGSIFGTAFCLTLTLSTGNADSLWLLAAVALLGFLYSTPLPYIPQNKIRLKNIPVVKNISSSIGWSLLVIFFPAVHAYQQVTIQHWIAAGLMFGAVWMVELIWDIRDQQGDRSAKVQTIPVLKGLERTQTWIFTINSLSVLGLFLAYAMEAVPAYWLLILFNNLLVYAWLSQDKQMLMNRSRSHLLIGLQTLLLLLLGYIAAYSHWGLQIQLV